MPARLGSHLHLIHVPNGLFILKLGVLLGRELEHAQPRQRLATIWSSRGKEEALRGLVKLGALGILVPPLLGVLGVLGAHVAADQGKTGFGEGGRKVGAAVEADLQIVPPTLGRSASVLAHYELG